jgi:hypothetical protein
MGSKLLLRFNGKVLGEEPFILYSGAPRVDKEVTQMPLSLCDGDNWEDGINWMLEIMKGTSTYWSVHLRNMSSITRSIGWSWLRIAATSTESATRGSATVNSGATVTVLGNANFTSGFTLKDIQFTDSTDPNDIRRYQGTINCDGNLATGACTGMFRRIL